MIEPRFRVGQSFTVQFVWRMPEGDFIRAVFEAEVLALDFALDRYLLQLNKLAAGRQESPDGEARPAEHLAHDYWELVGKLVGNRIHLAFEADDGRPIRLRPETLTGEHPFFTRLQE